ncbi:MAG: hypothetical protein LBE89_04220 [Helicobacteraceae bacterium]|jgi:hypothetical protein|nr:hypothetical protein [Helicobacteraceae bacterium]
MNSATGWIRNRKWMRRALSTIESFDRASLSVVAIVAAIVFATLIALNAGNMSRWEFLPDTGSYVNYDYANPWASLRSPGMPAYMDLIAQRGDIRAVLNLGADWEQTAAIAAADPAANRALLRISAANTIVIAFGAAMLAVALCLYLPPALAAFLTIAVTMCSGLFYRSYQILTEPPAIAVTLIFVAAMLLWLKRRYFWLLPALCLVAIAGFLIRPALIFLAPISALAVAIELWRNRRDLTRAAKSLVCGLLLCVGMLAFPFQLYLQSGEVTLGGLSGVSKLMFALFIAEPGDTALMQTDEQKAALEKFFELKPESNAESERALMNHSNELNHSSLALRYVSSVNLYGHALFNRQIMGDSNLSPIDLYRFDMAVAKPIINAHFGRYLEIIAANFASAFGGSADYFTSPILRGFDKILHIPTIVIRLIFPLCFALIAFALWRGRRDLRLPTAALALIHLLHVLGVAIGHAALSRYVLLTEWSLVLSAIMAAFSLIAAKFPFNDDRKGIYAQY